MYWLAQVKKTKYVSLGPSVVEKFVDSRYRYDTDTDLADLNLAIGYPMQLVTDSKVSIEPLDINWHKIAMYWLAQVKKTSYVNPGEGVIT
jgi:hypothetical protein